MQMKSLSITLLLTLCIAGVASANDAYEKLNYSCYAVSVHEVVSKHERDGIKVVCERLDGNVKTQLLKTFLVTYESNIVGSHREVTCNANFGKYIIVIPPSLTGAALRDDKGGIFIPFGNNIPPTMETTDIKGYFILNNDEKIKPQQRQYNGCLIRE